MIFLEVTPTTPDDIHINIKDVVYFLGFVVTLLTAWFKLKHDNDKQTEQGNGFCGHIVVSAVGCTGATRENRLEIDTKRPQRPW